MLTPLTQLCIDPNYLYPQVAFKNPKNLKTREPTGRTTIMKGISKYVNWSVASIAFAFGLSSQANASVEVSPLGLVDQDVRQIEINFGESMDKVHAFEVNCSPAVTGFGSWAANNTVYTYTFDPLPGGALVKGSKCSVTQTQAISSSAGKTFPAGSLNSQFTVRAPRITRIIPAPNGSYNRLKLIKEKDPVFLIQFDGPVSYDSIFSNAYENFLAYNSSNAPQETIPLVPVPAAQQEEIFEFIYSQQYLYGSDIDSNNWVLATVDRRLVPNAEVKIQVGYVQSLYNPEVINDDNYYLDEVYVRDNFKGELTCSRLSGDTTTCLPNSAVGFNFNAQTKWSSVAEAYVEYTEFGTGERKKVYPTSPFEENETWIDAMTGANDSKPVTSLQFDVKIEAETVASLVLPEGLKDTDGRWFQGATTVRIPVNTAQESYTLPGQVSVYERQLPGVSFRFEAVNLNQEVTITRSGSASQVWAPITSAQDIMDVVKAYDRSGYSRNEYAYQSPLAKVGQKLNSAKIELPGEKNRNTVGELPFAGKGAVPMSGVYAVEVSSPGYLAANSDPKYDNYKNPEYTLAQVTDLGVILKQGQNTSNVWVSSLSQGSAVAGAKVSVYSCDGAQVASFTTDGQGLAAFDSPEAKECPRAEGQGYSSYDSGYFVFVEAGDDISFIHSNWNEGGYIFNAPGIEYFSSDISDGSVYYHTIIGVNLVKPGQEVPVQILATKPSKNGFSPADVSVLPTKAKIVNYDNGDISYSFDITWNDGLAEFNWQVPGEGSVELGAYYIILTDDAGNNSRYFYGQQIEVSEFQVPLMKGSLSFAEGASSDAIPVTGYVQFSNGIGAKNLELDFTYFFSNSYVSFEGYEQFAFSKGEVKLDRSDSSQEEGALPSDSRPGDLQDVLTDNSGNAVVDIAAQALANGQTVADALSETKTPQSLIVRAIYPDQVGEFQTLSASKTIYPTDVLAGVKLVSGAKTEAKLQAVAVNNKGVAVTGSANIQTQLQKIETNVIGETLYGGLIKNRVERTLEEVDWEPNCALEGQVLSCGVSVIKAGSYAFSAKVGDNETFMTFNVNAEGQVYENYWYGEDNYGGEQVALELDKELYQADDVATVSFEAPFDKCSAWVSLERADVIESFIAANACEAGAVNVQLKGEQAPNVFVSVVFFTGRAEGDISASAIDMGRPAMKTGYANAIISTDAFVAEMEVSLENDVYGPQEIVKGTVNLGDSSINDGYVTVVAIEENILNLRPNSTYDVVSALLKKRGHNISVASGLSRVASSAASADAIVEAAAGARKVGDEGGDGGPSAADFARKDFDSLVEFGTMIPVANGEAKFEFKTNDQLAKFKVFAVYVDPNSKFGFAESGYLAEKSTQVFSNLPVKASNGDSFPAIVNVQNNTKEQQSYQIQLSGEFYGSNGQQVSTVSMTGAVALDSPYAEEGTSAAAVELGQMNIPAGATSASYTVTVINAQGEIVDAIQIDDVRVTDPVPLRVFDLFLAQTENGEMSFVLKKPETAVPGKGEIAVSAQSSLVASALAAIEAKIAESNFTAIFFPAELVQSIIKLKKGDSAPIQASMSKLIAMTDAYGMVKYSKDDDEGSLGLTLNILNMLALSPETKAFVPAPVMSKWQSLAVALFDNQIPNEKVSKSAMGYFRAQAKVAKAASYLGGNAVAKAVEFGGNAGRILAQDDHAYGPKLSEWSSNDLVLLIAALNSADIKGGFAYKQAMSLMTKAPRIERSGQIAKVAGSPSFGIYYSDETIVSAELLVELVKGGADDQLTQNLAIGLINSSQRGWYNVVTMGYVLGALEQFGNKYEAVKVAGVSTLSVEPGAESMNVVFADNQVSGDSTLVAAFPGDQATASAVHGGQGEVWFTAQSKVSNDITEPFDQGLAVRKTVRNVNRASMDQTEAGDLIEVELTLSAGAPVANVAMFDPIPSGATIVGKPYGGFYSNTVVSYDGAKFLFNYVSEGGITLKYQYRVNNKGTFKVGPTRAEALYEPATFGEAPNGAMTVK
jgi:hypothetical protein